MTIWVDADALPGVVKELLVRASMKRGVEVVLVANRYQADPPQPQVRVVRVAQGDDVADDYIVEHCQKGDLVVSEDVPLAARAVEKGARVLQPRGELLDADNARERLSIRDFQKELRDSGIETSGPAPFSKGDRQKFANGLDRWLTSNSDS